MAVVVQEMVLGERSGVVFGMSPVHEEQSAVEAVYGLEPGTGRRDRGTRPVDPRPGTVGRSCLIILPAGKRSSSPARRVSRLESLPPELQNTAPLRDAEVRGGLWARHEGGVPVRIASGCGVDLPQGNPPCASGPPGKPEVRQLLERILDQFGDLAWENGRLGQDRGRLLRLVLQMASRSDHGNILKAQKPRELNEAFLSCFEEAQQPYALELLDLARASYRLRDDDNISIGKIEGQVLAVVAEAIRRLNERPVFESGTAEPDDLLRAVQSESSFNKPNTQAQTSVKKSGFSLKSRQILGQPAGPGMAMGKARVVLDASDLFSFQRGEILVCDAVDPAMTFVVPLASGIVERRGGMLIHGAIIAREYGIPCVTGVPDAVNQIRTGDFITVDGHLGIVIIGEASL